MSRRISLGEVAKRATDTSIHAAREVAAGFTGALAVYDRLHHEIRSRTELLSRRATTHAWEVNRGLLAMALHHDDWLKPVESWSPPSAAGRVQLASLSEHLFARFPMPQFMTSVWFQAEIGVRTVEQDWYKRLGLGHNIRSVNVPMHITRGMAHQLLSAPCHFTMVAALRWAQLTDLEAPEALVQAVLETRLGRIIDNEDYWEEVLQFFVNHPELPLDQIGPVVDFLEQEKPQVSIKGRSVASLLRLVRRWHRDLGRRAIAHVSWPRAPLNEFRWLEKRRLDENKERDDRLWTITELCTSRELVLEGRAMRHCVSTYVRACTGRRASIWTMQVETRKDKHRVLTIEVDLPRRRVVQARGKHNASPSPHERTVVRRWAEREGLFVSPAMRDLA